MNLRRTTLLSVFATFLMLAVVLSISMRSLLTRHFRYEETQQSNLNLQRVESAFENNYTVLNYFADDWGKWNDTYAFVQDGNFEYINDNLVASTFQDLNVNIIVIADLQGNVYYAGAYDLQNDEFVRVPASLSPYLQPESALFDPAAIDANQEGVIFVDERPLLTVVGPILPSDGIGEPRGMVLFGRYFSDSSILQLAQEVQYPIRVVNFNGPSMGDDFLLARRYFLENPNTDFYSQPLSSFIFGGYLLLRDINQNPALILRIEQPRTSARNTELLMNYLLFSLIAASLIFAAIFFGLIQRIVLSRVFRLGSEVQEIARNPERISSVTVDKKDEIGALSEHINTMLDALAKTQEERNQVQQRLAGVITSIDDIVFTISANMHQIRFYGRKSVEYGFKDMEIPDYMQIDELPMEWVLPHKEPVARALAGEHLVYEWVVELQGEVKHFQISISPLYESGETISGIVGVGREVTNLKTMEIQLRQRFEELSVLYDASKLFLTQKDVSATQEALCSLAVTHFDVLFAWLGAYDQETETFSVITSSGLPPEAIRPIRLTDMQADTAKRFLEELREKTYASYASEELYPQITAESPNFLVLPLHWLDGPLLALFFGSREIPQFNEPRQQFLRSFANLAEMALASSMLFEELENSRERLQDLSEQLVKVHEEERRWLARELHDEIGQYLTALKLRLDVEGYPTQLDMERIQQARSLVDELIGKVRQMSLDLRPSILDDLGLLPALEWLLDRYTQQTEIKVDFSHGDLQRRRFAPELELTAFRVVQEALTNVARYAGVKEVEVEIMHADEALRILVRDRGAGFNPDVLKANGRSSGILGMQERVRLLRGKMSVSTAHGSGTEIRVELPLNRKRDDDTNSDS